MGEKTLISIIIPTYNSSETICECIDSIIQQSFCNIEIIIIDDGSTDNTVQILEEYVNQDKRIRYFVQKNKGPGAARNVGIRESIGSYITFIDADDVIDSNYINKLYKVSIAYQAKLVLCLVQRFKEINKLEYIFDDTVEVLDSKALLTRMMYQKPRIGGVLAKLFHRSVIEGHYFTENVWIGEDVEYAYKVYMNIEKAALLHSKLYGYREKKGSISRNGFSSRNMSCVEVSRKMYNDISNRYPDLTKCVASRAFVMNRVEYAKTSSENHEERIKLWNEMQLYKKYIISDDRARFRDRVFAISTFGGHHFFNFMQKISVVCIWIKKRWQFK